MLSEETPPYGSAPSPASADLSSKGQGQASVLDVRKVRTVHLQAAKEAGEKFAMLTSYDALTAGLFDAAGVDLLLVGDSASTNVLGQASTLEITVDQMIPMVRAVSSAARRALVVADLPFGSYAQGPAQAIETAVRFMKEGGAEAVKMEVASPAQVPLVAALAGAGIPVMAHIGFTPQSEHALGGYRVQGRGGAEALVALARQLEEAGAFSLLLEMTKTQVANLVDEAVAIPVIGIGAGGQVSGQVLVWQDAFGLRQGKMARFVKQYAQLADTLLAGAADFRADVRSGAYPAPEHRFDD